MTKTLTENQGADSDAIVVTDNAGIEITGLTPGDKYAIEAYNGPWHNGSSPGTLYAFTLTQLGYSWYGQIGLDQYSTMQLVYPPWCALAEGIDAYYARAYFTATETSIKTRVWDGKRLFGDNTGSLSWRLREATFDSPTKNLPQVHAVRHAEDGVPMIGDRAAWLLDYDTLHASDIYKAVFQGHLPNSGTSGNVIYDYGDEWKSGTPATVGLEGEKVKVSSNDTTAGYLNGKLVADTRITLTEGSDGGDEM